MADTKSKTVETIEILNADGTPGGRLTREKYEATRDILLRVIPTHKDGVAFKELAKSVQEALPRVFLPAKGSASWLATTVKLDLEGRGLIERVPGAKPQRLRRK